MMRTLLNSRRSRTGCSILALATVLAVGASPASAQSFQGTGTFTSGTGTIVGAGNTTSIIVDTPTAVINWIPTDNVANPNVPIVFQPGGTFADFSGGGNYAVLNRISVADATRVIQLDGTIRTVANGQLNGNGSIYFYSPSGFLLGGSSVINVPSLVLSALPIMADANGNFIVGADRTVTFGAAVNANASITTMPGSQITGSMTGSYVAMVAPRVAHHGTITTNGQAALVAAEAATINFSPDGLFDISVTTGTTDANGIALHGDIVGQASTGVGDNNRIYAVAVPKNDVLTMVIGSGADLGFAIAGAANVEGNAVVLTAGHNVTNGFVNSEATSATSEATMSINAPRATSAVTAVASGNLHLFANPGQVSNFASNLTLRGDDQVWARAVGVSSSLTVVGDLVMSADSTGGTGQSATAGEASLFAADGGVVAVNGDAYLWADGRGGSAEAGAPGNGTGGTAKITAQNGGAVGVLGSAYASASGYGGDASDANGGIGTGGTVEVTATNGAINIGTVEGGSLNLVALGLGGEASSGFTAGKGAGGVIAINATGGGDIAVNGSISGDASGEGGAAGFEVHGGDGEGGEVRLQAQGNGSSISAEGNSFFYANGLASEPLGDCTACGGIGGDGFGGDIDIGADGTGASIDFDSILAAFAEGYGGVGLNADGGFGKGGTVQLFAGNGGLVGIDDDVELSADGIGGSYVETESGDGLRTAGNGQGGFVELFTWGTGASDINLLGPVDLHADGIGGVNNVNGAGMFAGSGVGGTAWLDAQVGSIDITGNVIVSATGEGGDAAYGTGGDGTGKNAEIGGFGGDISIGGTARINVSGEGGNGRVAGGDGRGGGDVDPDGLFIDGAVIFAQNGSVAIVGTTTVDASGTGGNGLAGAFSSAGGTGGDAAGGVAGVVALNSNSGPSDISLSTLNISANGTGGAGGQGGSGNLGGNGGGGGDAFGGGAYVYAHAGNGHLTANSVNATAIATGGDGGDGGNGDGQAGGNGGAGGDAEGGGTAVGTASGAGQAAGSNLGTATFGTVIGDASAIGGDGGNGNFGSTEGIGGNGGTADGGGATLLVRGSTVRVNGSAALIANGTGGDGGSGAGETGPDGNGGNAFAGEVNVIASSRYLIPAQRGTLIANAITGTAIATGGVGEIDGIGTVEGGSLFQIDRSTVKLGTLSFTIDGDVVDAGADASEILITNSTVDDVFTVENEPVDVASSFSFSTLGKLSVHVDSGSLTTDALTLNAGNFVVNGDAPAVTNRGTIYAGSATITTGNNFVAEADFDVDSTLTIVAPGLIDAHDFTVAGNLNLFASGGGITVDELDGTGNIDVRALGNISFANADAGGSVYSRSSGTITGTDVDAGTFIDIGSTGGIDLDDLVAGGDIHLGSNGPIAVLTALSGETIHVETQGTLVTGSLTAGDSVLAQSMGAMTINGPISAGIVDASTAEGAEYRVSLASDSNITTQAITAAGEIGFGTPQNLVTGNLDAGGGIMALVGGDITLPTVQSDSYVFLADYSMAELGGEFENFDRSAVLSADPVLTGGSIDITGPLTAGSFVLAAAGTDLDYLSIVAGGRVDLMAGSDISGGSLTATDGDIDLDSGGNILFTTANAGGEFDFDAGGSISGGNVVAGNEIGGSAAGSVNLGNLTAGSPQDDEFSVGIAAVGNISVGNVSGPAAVGFATQGNLTTGSISAGELFMALVGGNITTAGINTSAESGGQVYLADDSMFLVGGGTLDGEGDFDPSIVLAQDPVRTGGSITINGSVTTGLFRAAAGTSLTTGTINTGGGIGLDANGAISTGNLVAGNFVLANGGSISTGSIDADSVAMESTGGNITIGGAVTADGLVELDAFGNIVTDDITAGTIELAAGGSITTENLTTELPPVLGAADVQAMPNVDPDGEGNIILIAGGNIVTGDITAAESILLVTPGTITGETIEAGNVFMALAHGDMIFGDANAAEVFLADFAMYTPSGGGGDVGAICIGACGILGADGVVTAPPSGTTYHYVTTAGGQPGAGQLPGEGGTSGSQYTTSAFSAAAGDDLEFWFNYVTSDGSGYADYAWASLLTSSLDPVAILFTARTQASGTIVPGFDLPGVEATLNPATVPIIDGGPAWSALGGDSGSCYSAGCGYTGWVNSTYEIAEAGNYVLRFGVSNWSDSSYQSGMAFSGITIGGVPVESTLTPTGGSITIGNVTAGKMTAAAGTTLTTGIIDTSDFTNLVSGGNMVTGAITGGNNIWADAGGTMALGALSAGNIELVSGGNMAFASANAGTAFSATSDAAVTGGQVTAGEQIDVIADGLVTINGNWSAPDVEITSNDIDIAATGQINAGDVQLYSTNATQTVVGDGVAGGGYQVSDAEFNRINFNGELEIGAWTGGGANERMLFGDLTYTDDSEGSREIEFAVFEDDSETGDGSMRIVGDMVFNGMGSEDSVQFTTSLFELDAATGSVALYSNGTTLGGELQIQSPHIRVASGQILDQLANNPTYAGYQQDLNKPATVQRPDGVIKAASISLDLEDMGDSATIYVQNTGTTQTPAGFLVTDEIFIGEDGEFTAPAGSVNLIINGQIITESGTLTGIAVRDAMVAGQGDTLAFTANSTINGCPLTGACIIQSEEPPPNPDVVDDTIDLITDNPLGDGDFGNEDSIDDNEEGDEGAENPISPPQPLFDTRPLVPSGDVNDPVSGTGNPALMGGETECEEGEDGQCPASQNDGEGQ